MTTKEYKLYKWATKKPKKVLTPDQQKKKEQKHIHQFYTQLGIETFEQQFRKYPLEEAKQKSIEICQKDRSKETSEICISGINKAYQQYVTEN